LAQWPGVDTERAQRGAVGFRVGGAHLVGIDGQRPCGQRDGVVQQREKEVLGPDAAVCEPS
jgi:hypothetical protein